jgi:hypothetical protein
MKYEENLDTPTDTGTILRYPVGSFYVIRDQALRTGDETTFVVIDDIADALESVNHPSAARARELSAEAASLWPDGNVSGWAPTDHEQDPTGDYPSETLQWIREEAEALEGIYVEWNGEAGTVMVTLSDPWQEVPVYFVVERDDEAEADHASDVRMGHDAEREVSFWRIAVLPDPEHSSSTDVTYSPILDSLGGIELEGRDDDWSNVYSDPEAIGHEYLTQVARELAPRSY